MTVPHGLRSSVYSRDQFWRSPARILEIDRTRLESSDRFAAQMGGIPAVFDEANEQMEALAEALRAMNVSTYTWRP